MKLFILILLLVPTCAVAETIIREYFYVQSLLTWNASQSYCRKNYRDLATISNAEEQQRIVDIINNYGIYAWIGLYRQKLRPDVWLWSDGEPVSFLEWDSSQNYFQSFDINNCSVFCYNHWRPYYCGYSFFYICYRFLILVQEKKTWDDAQQYCRTHYTELAHLTAQTQLQQLNKAVETTQTENVWMGLHFYDGQWLWMTDKQFDTLNGQPSCPPQPFHCGAYKTTKNTLENRDCNEKLNFLCYLD